MASTQKGFFFPACIRKWTHTRHKQCTLPANLFMRAPNCFGARFNCRQFNRMGADKVQLYPRARASVGRCVFHFYYLPSAFHSQWARAARVHLRALANLTRCARLVSPPRPINNRAHVQTSSFALHVHFQYVSTGQLIEFGNERTSLRTLKTGCIGV